MTWNSSFPSGGETDAIKFLAKVAKELHDTYPSIHYHLYSGNAL